MGWICQFYTSFRYFLDLNIKKIIPFQPEVLDPLVSLELVLVLNVPKVGQVQQSTIIYGHRLQARHFLTLFKTSPQTRQFSSLFLAGVMTSPHQNDNPPASK